MAVISGLSVYVNLAGELVVGGKTYSARPIALAESNRLMTQEVHAETLGSYAIEGTVVTATASAPTANSAGTAIRKGVNGAPKSIAIGDEHFALPSMRPSQTASVDGNGAVAEASGIYNINSTVAIAGIGTGRLSDLTVPIPTSSDDSSLVGSQVASLPPMNATSTTKSGVITSPGASVTTPRGAVEASSSTGPSTSHVLTCKARKGGGCG